MLINVNKHNKLTDLNVRLCSDISCNSKADLLSNSVCPTSYVGVAFNQQLFFQSSKLITCLQNAWQANLLDVIKHIEASGKITTHFRERPLSLLPVIFLYPSKL